MGLAEWWWEERGGARQDSWDRGRRKGSRELGRKAADRNSLSYRCGWMEFGSK